jgi:hypothetical protein
MKAKEDLAFINFYYNTAYTWSVTPDRKEVEFEICVQSLFLMLLGIF